MMGSLLYKTPQKLLWALWWGVCDSDITRHHKSSCDRYDVESLIKKHHKSYCERYDGEFVVVI